MMRTSAGPVKAYGSSAALRNDTCNNHYEYAGAYFATGMLSGFAGLLPQSAAVVTGLRDRNASMILGACLGI